MTRGSNISGGGDLKSGLTTMMVIDQVHADRVADYERWVAGIHERLAVHPGFVSVDMIRRAGGAVPEYVVLVKFDSSESLHSWRTSDVLENWLAKLEGIVVRSHHSAEAIGAPLWFDLAPADPDAAGAAGDGDLHVGGATA